MNERETLVWIQGYLEGKAFLSENDIAVVSAKISNTLKIELPKYQLDLDKLIPNKDSGRISVPVSPYRGFPYGEVTCAAYNSEDHF